MRYIFCLFTAVLLAIAIGALVLWPISYRWRHAGRSGARTGELQAGFESNCGSLELIVIPRAYSKQEVTFQANVTSSAQQIFWYARRPRGLLGIGIRVDKVYESLGSPHPFYQEVEIVLPYWFIAVLAAIIPVCVIVRWLKQRRRIVSDSASMRGYEVVPIATQ